MKKDVEILRCFSDSERKLNDSVVVEFSLPIYLNNKKFATLLCSPAELDFLLYGFLYSSSIIKDFSDIEKCTIKITQEKADIIFSQQLNNAKNQIIEGGDTEAIPEPATISKIQTNYKINRNLIFQMMRKFEDNSTLFKETGAVHSNCLCEHENILLFSEDVARHNAVDKTVGKALVKNIQFANKYLLVSCRISKALALKIARAGIPIVASVSAVTDSAIKICQEYGVTLIGFVRNNRMNIYTHPERII